MLCVPIVGPTRQDLKRQIAAAEATKGVHLLEFRADLWDELYYPHSILPVILTLRGKQPEAKRLLASSPAYIDLMHDTPLSFVEEIGREFPQVKRIISYHNYERTPEDLSVVLQQMRSLPAELYKIVCLATSSSDALRMVALSQKEPDLLAISMGERGQITRLLARPWSFAPLVCQEASALGQLTVEELYTIYGRDSLVEAPALYGLIGNPVTKSLSHLTHNRLMQKLGLSARYGKMVVDPEELPHFLRLAREVGWRGLSVTIPLKELVLPHLDEIDERARAIGAVNTILFSEGHLVGYNTDAAAALDAIESRFAVAGRRMVILGAGGAARAILYEAQQRGAEIVVLNRTAERAKSLAAERGIAYGTLDSLKQECLRGYDILVNATPDPMPVPEGQILPGSLVMETKTNPKMNPFLESAVARGCQIVYGYEMFVNQAVGQFALWFPGRAETAVMRRILEQEVVKHL